MSVEVAREGSVLAQVRLTIEQICEEKRATIEDYFRRVIRQALDEVIDGPRTGRWSLNQLAKTEKAYVGTKFEIILRADLDVPCGVDTDCRIAGIETDIKWSQQRGKWMIGPENVGKVCLGASINESETEFSVGLFVPYLDRLGAANRDQKRTLTRKALIQHVNWLVDRADFPPSFIASLDDETRRYVFDGLSAQERVRRLAERMPFKFIPRQAFETVAMKPDGDPIRRLRRDRSNESGLGGVRLLSTKYGAEEIRTILGWEPEEDLPANHWFVVPQS